MNHYRSLPGILAVLALAGSAVPPVAAQLPSLHKQPWLGHFAAFSNKRYQFGVSLDGKLKLTPMNEKGDPVAQTLAIPIELTLQEIMPSGKVAAKKIKPESLQSKQPATDKLEKLAITGQTTGGASFEVFLEQDRNVISIGGRLRDRGSLKKNPVRFFIAVKFPDPYPYAKKTGDRRTVFAFEKDMRGDRIELKWVDEKHRKLKLDEKVGQDSKEVNGPGIASAELYLNSYKGRKFEFRTTPNATMTLWNAHTLPLHEGFTIVWAPDAAKDPDGKARLSFEVK